MSTLAIQPDEKLVSAKSLSGETGIPLHYLSKVMRKLVEAGLLDAVKGHSGGFALARSPQKIRMVDIIEAIEAEVPVKHCIFGWRACNSNDPCILHHRWNAVNDAFQEWARKTTLADIRKGAAESSWLLPETKKKRAGKA